MSTVGKFPISEIKKSNPIFSMARTTIETAFYGNNVVKVTSLREAYKLAAGAPGTVVTDMPVKSPGIIGLDAGSKVLLFNDGAVTGRTAAARKIVGEPGVDEADLCSKIREAIYQARGKKLYHGEAYVGLHEDFMVKAHMLLPEGEEMLLYNWMLNFQYLTDGYVKMYKQSRTLQKEGDIFFFADPTWKHPDHPMGLAFFDPLHNCAAVLGMRYFGELKKGTLTLAWGIAARNGYASCHGGQKRYNLPDGRKFVAGVFGLSGSGKSTITHAKHNGKYDITVLHDDAFVISTEDGSSVALEPAYFDKTQDYPMDSPDNAYLLTVQNVGATIDRDGRVVLMTEDLRNGNGRAVKSRLWSPNRVDKFDEPVNAIFWLMKDPTLPPVLKVKGAALASVMGAALATKRTSAERLAPGVDPDALVFEPYANPFRTYPLAEDYKKFKSLFEERHIDCYILNTGFFLEKKITPEITLGCLEAIIEEKGGFKPWAHFTDIDILEVPGFVPDLSDGSYKVQLTARMMDRLQFLKGRKEWKGGFDALPEEAIEAIKKLIHQL